ncbi:YutD-like domain-containing protein [Paenibacillus guangzhouensis]|uniref:YutD-like domain-containing protein n=1 Tax=Paenibacillus guangzhouensis TaxID=1473112 RepID=UPI0012670B7F|nr:YutD-like domain-containing protein [Paenibacillus guangzhouensis]
MIHITGKTYEVITDHKNGWNPEAFKDRYSDVLDRYDYIIGDWGYNQLRLKGFFRDNNSKATKDTTIASMVDYINEYCNFGCAYFVVEKIREQKPEKSDKPEKTEKSEKADKPDKAEKPEKQEKGQQDGSSQPAPKQQAKKSQQNQQKAEKADIKADKTDKGEKNNKAQQQPPTEQPSTIRETSE